MQLSFQDSTREMNDFLSHTKTFELKNRWPQIIKDQGWPMVMNVVIHRLNIDHIDRIIGMAAELGAEYLELANTQYYSLGLREPRRSCCRRTSSCSAPRRSTDAWRAKLGDRMRIFFVAPDYHEGKAKKCVNGWGSMFLTVAPDGTALPCHTAKMLPGLTFPNVREHGAARDLVRLRRLQPLPRHRLDEGALRELRHKEEDLGGCRCQAFLLARTPTAADPVCRRARTTTRCWRRWRRPRRQARTRRHRAPAGVPRPEGVTPPSPRRADGSARLHVGRRRP